MMEDIANTAVFLASDLADKITGCTVDVSCGTTSAHGKSRNHLIPLSAILLPAAFFFSVLTPDATKPNGLIYLAYVGAVILAAGLLILGIGRIQAE